MTGQSDSIAALLGEGNSHSNRNQKLPLCRPSESPDGEPPARPKRGGLFGKFNNENRKLKQTQKPVETLAHAPQVREELDFDAKSLPVAKRIQYPEVFETSPVTIDTAAAGDAVRC